MRAYHAFLSKRLLPAAAVESAGEADVALAAAGRPVGKRPDGQYS